MTEPVTKWHYEVVILIVEGTDIRKVPAALYRAESRMPDNAGVEGNVREIASTGRLREYEGSKWKSKPCRYATVVVPRALFDAAITEGLVRNDYVSVGCEPDEETPLLAIIGPSQSLGPASCAPWLPG